MGEWKCHVEDRMWIAEYPQQCLLGNYAPDITEVIALVLHKRLRLHFHSPDT